MTFDSNPRQCLLFKTWHHHRWYINRKRSNLQHFREVWVWWLAVGSLHFLYRIFISWNLNSVEWRVGLVRKYSRASLPWIYVSFSDKMDSGRFDTDPKVRCIRGWIMSMCWPVWSQPYAFHQVLRSLFSPFALITRARGLELVTELDPEIDLVLSILPSQ